MSVLSERTAKPRNERAVKNPIPWYTPRFWHGMRFSTWFSTLAKNRFAVSLSRVHTATSITLISAINSALAVTDRAVYSRKISDVEISKSPIFILGHWRSGTTFLHELLIRDPGHTYPTTYQCFVPDHFVLTESWLAPLTSKLLPSRRPMDNMEAGWCRPQEDEFALANMGIPSPYLSMLFPARGEANPRYLDLHQLDEQEQQHWRDALMSFFPPTDVSRSTAYCGEVAYAYGTFEDIVGNVSGCQVCAYCARSVQAVCVDHEFVEVAQRSPTHARHRRPAVGGRVCAEFS